MLVKLTPGFDLTNILLAAFARADLKSEVFFALLGSAHERAVHRMLVKLTHAVNFINSLQAEKCHVKLFCA